MTLPAQLRTGGPNPAYLAAVRQAPAVGTLEFFLAARQLPTQLRTGGPHPVYAEVQALLSSQMPQDSVLRWFAEGIKVWFARGGKMGEDAQHYTPMPADVAEWSAKREALYGSPPNWEADPAQFVDLARLLPPEVMAAHIRNVLWQADRRGQMGKMLKGAVLKVLPMVFAIVPAVGVALSALASTTMTVAQGGRLDLGTLLSAGVSLIPGGTALAPLASVAGNAVTSGRIDLSTIVSAAVGAAGGAGINIPSINVPGGSLSLASVAQTAAAAAGGKMDLSSILSSLVGNAAGGLLDSLNLPPFLGDVAKAALGAAGNGAQVTIPGVSTPLSLNLSSFTSQAQSNPLEAVSSLLGRVGFQGAGDFLRDFAPGLVPVIGQLLSGNTGSVSQLMAQLGTAGAGDFIDQYAPQARPLFNTLVQQAAPPPAYLSEAGRQALASGNPVVTIADSPTAVKTVDLREFIARASGTTPRQAIGDVIASMGWQGAGKFVARITPGLRPVLADLANYPDAAAQIIAQMGADGARRWFRSWAEFDSRIYPVFEAAVAPWLSPAARDVLRVAALSTNPWQAWVEVPESRTRTKRVDLRSLIDTAVTHPIGARKVIPDVHAVVGWRGAGDFVSRYAPGLAERLIEHAGGNAQTVLAEMGATEGRSWMEHWAGIAGGTIGPWAMERWNQVSPPPGSAPMGPLPVDPDHAPVQAAGGGGGALLIGAGLVGAMLLLGGRGRR